ncbi:MAG: protein kinase [Gemmatimonadaceae bacterium]
MTESAGRLAAALADRYRIERELGQGGMATVFLAEDIKHKRRVAVKVLKPELAAVLGAERFVQEITTTAALQHPHILPLFDSGTADGFLYYVMPFIDGETLRDKLNRETQFGVDEAVKITIEVADALHYAHTQGVIHRDIKPENILMANGRPMVADFGIALAVSAAAGGRMTETGLSLGTPHYMSPEQATAEKEISARSDVYSLGSVLYEMLAGQPPHLGGSAQQIIMKIIAEPAEAVTKYRRSVPPNVAAAVAHALEKLPADRFASAKLFAEALANPAFGAGTVAFTAGRSGAPSSGWKHRVAVPALAMAIVLALTTAWSITRPVPKPEVSRYVVGLPEGERLGMGQWGAMAASPDGSRLVYIGESGRLLVRSRNDLKTIDLPGTEGAFNPFFSPDGSRIGFMHGGAGAAALKVVAPTGGPVVTIPTGPLGGPGITWGHDGFIYFDHSGVGPLMRVAQGGGTPEAMSTLDSAAGELQHDWPDMLPSGRGVLMTIDRGGPGVFAKNENDIGVLDLATRRHRVLAHGVYARYAASGHIIYVTADGALMAMSFDQDKLEVTGDPVVLIEGVNLRSGGGGVDVTISSTGTLWYSSGASRGRQQLLWATRRGVFTEVDSALTGDFGTLAISPDGTKLAVSIEDATGEHIWMKTLNRQSGPLSKLSFDRSNRSPRWHPDGTRILFTSSFLVESVLRIVRADGSTTPEILRDESFPVSAGEWTRDGRWLVYGGRLPSSRDILGVRMDGDSIATPLAATPFQETAGTISPDGRWLAFESDRTGQYEIYVRPFPNSAAALTQVSTGGGSRPRWSANGRELHYFGARSGSMMSTEVIPAPAFSFKEQTALFSRRGIVDYDVASDGRFIVIRTRDAQQGGKLIVVENFFEELREKARPRR